MPATTTHHTSNQFPGGRRPHDLTGRKFGKWTVLGFSHKASLTPGHVRLFWKCRCTCGTTRPVAAHSLLGGASRSCGCGQTYHTTHGATRGEQVTPEYSSWSSMRRHHRDSGEIVSAWADFATFLRDMGPRPAGHRLVRINIDLPYGPGNCRWRAKRGSIP